MRGVGDALLAAIRIEPRHSLRVAVRVEDRGHEDHAGRQYALDLLAARRGQVIDEGQRSIHAAGLSPVHTVVDPGYNRHVVGYRLAAARLGQRDMAFAYVVQLRMIGW